MLQFGRIEPSERLGLLERIRLNIKWDIHPHRTRPTHLRQVGRLLHVVTNAIRIQYSDGVFTDRFDDRDDVHFLNAELAHSARLTAVVEHAVRPLHLSRDEQTWRRVKPCPCYAGHGVCASWASRY